MAFEALIFDAGGVFVPHDNAALHARLASRCAVADAADRLSRLEMVAGANPYATGELPIEHLHGRLREEIGYGEDWDVFVADWCSHLSIDRSMLSLIARLSRANRVMVFSNTNAVHWSHVVRMAGEPLAQLQLFLSHEIRAAKPEEAAFRLVAQRAGVDPSRTLFVDDVLENVEAARRVDFQAHHFTGQPALEAHLRAHGVVWPAPTPTETVP